MLKKVLKLLLITNFILLTLLNTIKLSYSFENRYVFEDRKINNIAILPFETDDKLLNKEILDTITTNFFQNISNNSSGIKFNFINNDEIKNFDYVISGKVEQFHSTTEKIVISGFYNYDLFEQQIKVSVEIKVKSVNNQNLIWKRKASKYNNQRWIEFNRPQIGINELTNFFYLPSQLIVNLKKKYDNYYLINKTINDVNLDLVSNLVRQK